LEHRLSSEEEAAVLEATRELVADAAETIRRHEETGPPTAITDPSALEPREPLRVLGYAVTGLADEVALEMLAHLVGGLPYERRRVVGGTSSPRVLAHLASVLADNAQDRLSVSF
jgi:hypothetical protein